LAREQRRARGQRQQGQREIKLQAEIDKLNTELTQLKQQGVAEGVSLKQKHEDKKRADQNQVRYGKMTQAEFDKKWTRTERPKPTDKEQGVAEGNQEEKIGGRYDADDFDDMVSRLKKLAGAGPMKTVYDPDRRVYRNMPTAQQPAQQPKKAPR
jgi:hypothetical protein